MMLDPLNKILISYFGSLSLVAFYEIGFRMINLATNAFQSLTGSILPALTKMNTESGLEKVKPMFHYSSKYVSFFAIPVFALIFILSKPFVETWMGPGFETSIVTLQIMILPYMVGILTNPAFLCIQAIGYPQYAMTVVAIRGILNLVLGYIFIRVFGYYGLLIAIALASIISSICIEIILHRVIKTSILNTLFVIINKIAILNLFVSIILFIFINYINLNGYFNLILCAILYLGFSTSLMFFISWLDDKDRQILKPILPVTIYSKLT
jgi:O-antigen/teichoic acid export membrane protein